VPSSSHILYIPACILIGVIIGFIMGARAARDRANLAAKRDELRKDAREQRAARRAAKQSEAGGGESADDDD
jgi:hypothetical protein